VQFALTVPAVRDRVAQEVVRRLLNPIFEPLFHPSSFGFRQKRNCHMAIEAALKLHDAGYGAVVDADIKGFLDPSTQCPLIHEIGLVDRPLL
jgi:retron-type reverse transcriptase